MELLPEFHTAESEYSIDGGKNSARLLRSLTRNYPSELVSGVKINTGKGKRKNSKSGKQTKDFSRELQYGGSLGALL